jgi:hypothetical protein
MPALARVIEVCDEIVAYLKTNWTGQAPTITRSYMAAFQVESFTGPAVYVIPSSYGQVEILDRSEDTNEHTISIVFVDKYTEAAETIPTAWIDERVRLVEQQIYEPIGDHRNEAIDGLWPETATVNTIYDLDFLHQTRLFISEVEIGLREAVEG